MTVDLGFAEVTFGQRFIELKGKKGSVVRDEGKEREVPPATGRIPVPLDRFLEALGEVMMDSLRRESSTPGGEASSPEVEAGSPTGEAEQSERTPNQEGIGSGERRRFRFRGQEGLSLLLAPARGRIWLSLARVRDGKVIERTAGVVRLSGALVLADAAGRVLLEGKILRRLQPAVFLAEKGSVSFMDGSSETALQLHQRLELSHLLTASFLGAERPFTFRAGRVAVARNGDGRMELTFGRNRGELSPGDLMVIRSCL